MYIERLKPHLASTSTFHQGCEATSRPPQIGKQTSIEFVPRIEGGTKRHEEDQAIMLGGMRWQQARWVRAIGIPSRAAPQHAADACGHRIAELHKTKGYHRGFHPLFRNRFLTAHGI